ncbi:MAG: ASCH domain-containing protein [Pseudomonadota bacterium]
MILFKPEHVQPILEGRKTQTRRTGKRRWNVGAVHQARTAIFGEPFARLRIKDVHQESLGEIDEADARAEGYPSVAAYREAFTRIYGKWDDLMKVWVVDFEAVEEEKRDAV